ncbi:putative inorganic phosphate cotransporter [Trichonephila clavipes]|nr:putative inorganic phosphate cotransporter [Trichonephila clavipes]
MKKAADATYCFGKRHLITILGFTLCALQSANRVVVGVAIVAMVKHGHISKTMHRNTSELSCPLPETAPNTTLRSKFQGELEWDTKQQGYVLSVGFFGFLLTLIIGGKAADTFGAKSPLVVSNIIIGVCTFLSPFAAWWSIYAIIAVQLMRGLTQGFFTPAVYRLMSDWYPRSERGFLSTLVLCGYAFGVVVGGIVTGWLCDVPQLGWPSAFYFWGACTTGFAILLHFILYEIPQNHPTITEAELNYITEGQDNKMSKKRPPTPWKKIFSSVHIYAYLYGFFGYYWAASYFMSVHPTFVGTILHFSMTENGVVSCLPVLMTGISGLIASLMSNWLSKNNYIGVDKLRKTFTAVGAFGFSICVVGIILAGCDTVINILCFTLAAFIIGVSLSGVAIASIDMSPVFAGFLTGIGTCIASISTFILPILTGYLTTNETLGEWHSVFWITFAVVLSSGFVFIVFGSAEVQPWNFPEGKPLMKKITDEKNRNAAQDVLLQANNLQEI